MDIILMPKWLADYLETQIPDLKKYYNRVDITEIRKNILKGD